MQPLFQQTPNRSDLIHVQQPPFPLLLTTLLDESQWQMNQSLSSGCALLLFIILASHSRD